MILYQKIKKKYIEKSQKEKKEYEKKMMLFKNKKFDLPKKPKKAINYYVEEKIPLLLKDNPNINQKILLKQIMKEWERKEISDKANYNFKAEEDKKRPKKQPKEPEKKGHHTEGNVFSEPGEKKEKKVFLIASHLSFKSVIEIGKDFLCLLE